MRLILLLFATRFDLVERFWICRGQVEFRGEFAEISLHGKGVLAVCVVFGLSATDSETCRKLPIVDNTNPSFLRDLSL